MTLCVWPERNGLIHVSLYIYLCHSESNCPSTGYVVPHRRLYWCLESHVHLRALVPDGKCRSWQQLSLTRKLGPKSMLQWRNDTVSVKVGPYMVADYVFDSVNCRWHRWGWLACSSLADFSLLMSAAHTEGSWHVWNDWLCITVTKGARFSSFIIRHGIWSGPVALLGLIAIAVASLHPAPLLWFWNTREEHNLAAYYQIMDAPQCYGKI